MMKILVETVESLMQMNSFLFHNYWLLLGKKKIAKYSVFLVPSVGISGAEQCNCQYFRIGLG